MSTAPPQNESTAPGWLVWTALTIVYIVWGSTYLAIRVVVETMPPLLSAGVRFILAGLVVVAVLAIKRGIGGVRISAAEAGGSTLVGVALLLGGNGMVSIAEQHVPSGLTALIIASVPLWVVLLRAGARERVPLGTMAGVAVGFIGVAVLVLPGNNGTTAGVPYLLLIVLASMSWASGSFFSKKLPLPRDPFLSTAMQMLFGGAVMTAAAVGRGELTNLDVSSFSAASIAGLIYLVTFGSLLAFTSYVWLLQNAPISKVATYAYVNPVVAIILGWLILSERITPVLLAGAALIVASVAAVIRIESRIARQARAGAPDAPVPAEVKLEDPDAVPA